MADWGDLPPIVIDNNLDTPRYLQVARAIAGHIRSGNLPPQAKLPSENELDKLLGLSRSTVRKALEELEKQGLLDRRQGQGTFVADLKQAPQAKPLASGLDARPGRSGIIGLLVPTMLNEIYPQIVQGVEAVAEAKGYSVFIGNTYSDRARELSLMEQMIERGVDGLILEPTNARFDQPGTQTHQLLKSYPLPFVLIGNDIPGLAASEVLLDDLRGGQMATECLIERGHRQIAFIYKDSVLPAIDRRAGYEAALKAAGIEPDPEYILSFLEDDERQDPGYVLTKRLMAGPQPPSAIFFYNDELAFHGIRAIRDLGLEIPRDISVIGYDNISNAALPANRLSSIEHPKHFFGRWAADILFDQIDRGRNAMRRRILYQPELVLRESVGAPRRSLT